MSRNVLLIVLAVVLFAVALVLEVVGTGHAKLISELTLGGLIAFAAGHLP